MWQRKKKSVNLETTKETHEEGESFFMKRILAKLEKEAMEPAPTKSLFRTIYKSKGKCCKIVIDS